MIVSSPTAGLVGGEGTSTWNLSPPECGRYDLETRTTLRLDYQLQVEFRSERLVSSEQEASGTWSFRTSSQDFGQEGDVAEGSASRSPDGIRVRLDAPETEEIELASTISPVGLRSLLVDRAIAGERFVETEVYDARIQAEERLAAAALILPWDGSRRHAEDDPAVPMPRPGLKGLRRWVVYQDLFEEHADGDGRPISTSSFVLYENGVADDISIVLPEGIVHGRLTRLDLPEAPRCGRDRPPAGSRN